MLRLRLKRFQPGAWREQQSGVQVIGDGVVNTLLSDHNKGSGHQRFILRLASGQTLLFAHNIDLAPRMDALRQGDTVGFNRVYEWNQGRRRPLDPPGPGRAAHAGLVAPRRADLSVRVSGAMFHTEPVDIGGIA